MATKVTAQAALPLVACILAIAPTSTRAQCELDELRPRDPSLLNGFGVECALSWEGTTAAVATTASGGVSNAGSVVLFELDGAHWHEAATLTASDGAAFDSFGAAVAVAGDKVLVGAPRHATAGVPSSGAAYLYKKMGADWIETAKLIAPTPQGLAQFGTAVALGPGRLIVGAPGMHSGATKYVGAVYVFAETPSGSWALQDVLRPTMQSEQGSFGASLSLYGPRLLVGQGGAGAGAGRAYVFQETGGGWSQAVTLTPSDGQAYDGFGLSVAVFGNTCVIGSPFDDDAGLSSGSVYVFEFGAGVWAQVAKLLSPYPTPDDQFGDAVTLRNDRAAIGAPNKVQPSGLTGAVDLFEETASGWSYQVSLVPGALAPSFGESVSMTDDIVLCGAPAGFLPPGRASVFALSASAKSTLLGVPGQVSMSVGGSQKLYLNSCLEFAGDMYLVAGSLGGSSPGFVVGGLTVPLNPDGYFWFTLLHPSAGPLQASYGRLDDDANGLAIVTLPVGLPAWLIGTVITHAYVVLDATSQVPMALSNPIDVVLIP